MGNRSGFSLTKILYKGTQFLVFIAACFIFIPLLSTNARFADENFFACAFSEGGRAPECIWCLLKKYVAIALDPIIGFLNKVSAFLSGGSLTNPLTGEGGTPMQCLAKQGTTDYLTYFYAIIWLMAIYLFISITLSLIRSIAKYVRFILLPFTFISKWTLNFFFTNDARPAQGKQYRKLQ